MSLRLLVVTLALGTSLAGASSLSAQRSNRSFGNDPCQAEFGRGGRTRVCETRISGMRALKGPLTVDGGRNGGVTVTGWDRDSVHVVAIIQATAQTREDAQAMAGQVRVITDGDELRSEGPRFGRNAGWAVTFEISVPRHTDLTLTTANGPVEVENVTGTMRLDAENGPITLRAVGGDVQARAVNGPLSVQLTGSKWEGTGLDAETVNGPVDLRIPANYSANLETGTVNGPFDIDAPLTVTFQGRRASRIRSVLGSGGAPIRAVTTNGPVQISRRG
jgi:hypothetical protein